MWPQRCSLSTRRSEKLSLSEYSLERNGLYLSHQFSLQTLKCGDSFRQGWKRASAVCLQTSPDGKLKGIWVGQMPGLSSLVLFKRSLRFEYTESGSGSTIIQLQSCPSEARNRRELAVKAQASYLFTNCAFVFNPFNVSPLHFSQKRSSSFFSVAGDLPWREAPGISSSVSAREAAIRDDQNTGKNRPH